MKVVVIDYNSGNVQSVLFALKREGVDGELSNDPDYIYGADKVIFPGVGEASNTMNYLKRTKLDQVIRGLTIPVLGICLGMQLLCNYSEEGDAECLGIFPQKVERFKSKTGERLKIPHMGWNTVSGLKGDLFSGIDEQAYLYFVHSFKVELGDFTSAQCEYGGRFSAALERDNFFAVQFHPERSGQVGAQIIRNFIKL